MVLVDLVVCYNQGIDGLGSGDFVLWFPENFTFCYGRN
jgi:hypothetical protein